MSLDELYSLCPIELDAILDSLYKGEQADKEWSRLLTFILFNSQGGSEDIKSPKDLISLPWDEDKVEDEIVIPTNIDWDKLDQRYIGG